MDVKADRAAPERGALLFFNDFEARTVEAIAERIVPGDETDPGATEADVVAYIDRAVAGFSTALQKVYRLGLRDLDVFCRREYERHFVELDTDGQDAVVRRFLGPEAGEAAASHKPVGEDDYDFNSSAERPGHPLPRSADAAPAEPGADESLLIRLFAVAREHTIEGLFCDPAYGGNRNTVGWRLVGFPGVQWGYTAEQMKEGFDGRVIPIRTLADLRRGLDDLPDDNIFTRTGGV